MPQAILVGITGANILGQCLKIKTVFVRYGDSYIKITRSRDRLIFNMWIPILVKWHLYIKPWSAPSHYLNQYCNIVNWTLRIKLQWNFNQNSYILIQENAFENVVCEIAAIFSRSQCVHAAVFVVSDAQPRTRGVPRVAVLSTSCKSSDRGHLEGP